MTTEVPGDMPWMQTGGFNPEPTPARAPRQQRKPRAEPAAPKKPRKPRTVAAPSEAPAEPAKPRKAREPKADKAITNTVRVDIKQYAGMVVGTDAGTFIKVHGLLAALGKGSRAKVLAELQKVFG